MALFRQDRDASPGPRRRRALQPLGLRGLLAAFFAVITVLPLVAAVWLVDAQVDRLLRERDEQELATRVGLVTGQLRIQRDRAHDLATDLAARLAEDGPADELAAGDADPVAGWLARAAADAVPARADLAAVIDEQGEVLAHVGELRDGATLGERVAEESLPPDAIGGAQQVRGEVDGETVGTVGTVVALRWLDDEALDEVAVAGASLMVDGEAVATTPAGPAPAPVPSPGGVMEAQRGDEPVTTAAAQVGEATLVLWAPRPAGPALLGPAAAVLVPAIVLAALLGWVLASRVTAPIQQAAAAARAVAAGELGRRVPGSGPSEVRDLSVAFNRMADELQARLAELERNRDALAGSLHRIGQSLSSSLDLSQTLEVVAETAAVTLEADSGVVYLVDQEILAPYASYGEPAAPLPTLRLGEGIVGRVAQTAAPAQHPGDGPQPLMREPQGPCVAVPLLTRARVRGVLAVHRHDGDDFGTSALETLRTFATQAAVAVDNVDRHEEAERLAVTDPLTGLHNTRFLREQAEREVSTAERYGRDLAVAVVDLDHFKEVNDTYGHDAGDVVLTEVARRLDTVTRLPDLVARVGGEEFVVLLPGTDAEGARVTGERIREAVASTPIALGLERPALTVTCSVGVAERVHGEDADWLLRRADAALYAAKNAGRDRCEVAPSAPPRDA